MHIFAVVLLVALSRLIPHPPNFACIGAMALFAGYNIRSVGGLAIPLLALLTSDILGHLLRVPGMGFYEPLTMTLVYSGFAATSLLGRFLATRVSQGRMGTPWITTSLVAASLAGSTLFFLLSNFGVYLRGDFGYTIDGFVRCYVAAIPFFGNTVMGDLFFGVVLFGSAAAVGKLYGIQTTQPDLSGRTGISE